MLSHDDLVLQAESLQAFHIIDANMPFSATDMDGDRFRMQFPYWKIAQDYKQAWTKVKYVIHHGIVPVLKSQILKDIVGEIPLVSSLM